MSEARFTKEQVATWKNEGAVLLPSFFTPNEISQCVQDMRKVYHDRGPAEGNTRALESEDLHLYQSHAWANFTGEADYEQNFHCDFKNHTLTVPSDDTRLRTINFMIYLTDVTEAHGAVHYVPQSASNAITGPDRPMFLDGESKTQFALKAVQKSGAAPAGSIFAKNSDRRNLKIKTVAGTRKLSTISLRQFAAITGNRCLNAKVYSHAQPQ